MQCVSKAIGKPKKTFKTFEEAVAYAKRINSNPKFIHKRATYKCAYCLRFHTERSPHNIILTHTKKYL